MGHPSWWPLNHEEILCCHVFFYQAGVTQLFKSCGKTPGGYLSRSRRTHSRGRNVIVFICHHPITLRARLLQTPCGADSVILSLRQRPSAIAIYVPAPSETPLRSSLKRSSPKEASRSGEDVTGCGSKESASEGQPAASGSCLPAQVMPPSYPQTYFKTNFLRARQSPAT